MCVCVCRRVGGEGVKIRLCLVFLELRKKLRKKVVVVVFFFFCVYLFPSEKAEN